ncbi:dihydropteroate synthase [Ciceribacter sp. L1K22]|uniref:dihydropteroate synthase n=1 Tax=Ciceribacter sp. L1K22 TaxID=2820275 RepID=UPI001ABED879|nr:dihydropteroate synthase [Ciceribacter sp. L1K22]MBO3760668.1 dihydropteroate synthase [Ciceribacter sp. L1K22]
MEQIVRSTWLIGHGRQLQLGPESLIMAIVNVTPDSFSDGGKHATAEAALRHSLRCLEDGAHILDIGGESTRPGAVEVTADEEQDRVLPVIERLSRETDAVISIDTYRAETARLALAAGAHIVNDVQGLQREPDIAGVVASASAGVCIMHSGRGRARLADPIEDQKAYLARSLEIAAGAGIDRARIVLDPGFGFAKETEAENVELMARFAELHDLGLPLLVGTSRKRFLGTLTGRGAADRDIATAATSALLRLAGASVFRVHNVAANRDALKVADAMLAARGVFTEGQGL